MTISDTFINTTRNVELISKGYAKIAKIEKVVVVEEPKAPSVVVIKMRKPLDYTTKAKRPTHWGV